MRPHRLPRITLTPPSPGTTRIIFPTPSDPAHSGTEADTQIGYLESTSLMGGYLQITRSQPEDSSHRYYDSSGLVRKIDYRSTHASSDLEPVEEGCIKTDEQRKAKGLNEGKEEHGEEEQREGDANDSDENLLAHPHRPSLSYQCRGLAAIDTREQRTQRKKIKRRGCIPGRLFNLFSRKSLDRHRKHEYSSTTLA